VEVRSHKDDVWWETVVYGPDSNVVCTVSPGRYLSGHSIASLFS